MIKEPFILQEINMNQYFNVTYFINILKYRSRVNTPMGVYFSQTSTIPSSQISPAG